MNNASLPFAHFNKIFGGKTCVIAGFFLTDKRMVWYK
jgi:hypothetical protein